MVKAHKVELLFTEEEIKSRIAKLATQVALDYSNQELILVGILHGGTALLTDFARELWRAGLTTTVYKDYIGLKSYASEKSTGTLTYTKELKNPITGKHVLIVEDIVDTGRSLASVIAKLRTKKPRSLKTLALLSKPTRREVEVKIDYLGFTIQDVFVVGYDMDYDECYRTMPYIGKVSFD